MFAESFVRVYLVLVYSLHKIHSWTETMEQHMFCVLYLLHILQWGKWFLRCHDLFVLLFFFPDLPQFRQLHCEFCFSHPDSRCAELSNLQRIEKEPKT